MVIPPNYFLPTGREQTLWTWSENQSNQKFIFKIHPTIHLTTNQYHPNPEER